MRQIQVQIQLDEDIKEKDEKIEEELWTPKSSVKKTRMRESYLQQPEKNECKADKGNGK